MTTTTLPNPSIIIQDGPLAVGDFFAVYGTLRKGYGNHEGCQVSEKADFIDIVEISGYKMYAVQPSGGFPCLVVGDDSDTAVVEIYQVTDASIGPRLDGLEGYVRNNPEGSMYVRAEIDVLGSPCSIYIWNRSVEGKTEVTSGDWNQFTGRGR